MPLSLLVLPAPANLGPGLNTTSSSHYSYFILYIQPLKMELIQGSETSANQNRTPEKYPKEYIQEYKYYLSRVWGCMVYIHLTRGTEV